MDNSHQQTLWSLSTASWIVAQQYVRDNFMDIPFVQDEETKRVASKYSCVFTDHINGKDWRFYCIFPMIFKEEAQPLK
jgi:hypothetical protein